MLAGIDLPAGASTTVIRAESGSGTLDACVVTRVRARGAELDAYLALALAIAPTAEDDLADEDLELGWRIHGARIMSRRLRGTRPWG